MSESRHYEVDAAIIAFWGYIQANSGRKVRREMRRRLRNATRRVNENPNGSLENTQQALRDTRLIEWWIKILTPICALLVSALGLLVALSSMASR